MEYKEWSTSVLPDVALSIAGLTLVIESCFLLDRFLPWQKSLPKRLIVQLVVQVIMVFFIIVILKFFVPEWFSEGLIYQQTMVLGIIVSILISSIFTAYSFFVQWSQTEIKSAKNEQKAIQAQLDFLKTQIDPHFLFNNFSTLTSLIEDNPKLAVEYVQRLAVIYRHVLSDKEENVIRLADEMTFIESYLFLYQTRYQDSLIVEKHIPADIMDKYFATGSMQLLVENAIKHNAISRQKPLKIEIYAEEDFIIVKNNINPITKRADSTGIGLKNIAERYHLLSRQQIVIEQSSDSFLVKVPLLNSNHDFSSDY
ncbi:sensor histidine kinase [Chitinophaga sancti]|uniref:Histidine kinase n=1 Tax=Chitinophaga sancti TaxID=1004 RepID=A0ABZ0XMQ7_9BACT|nr:histidine kinase [Chitinophaga sancti]WQD62443.1 histidine kinase [Chitinophaga sancti]WQG91988.1 histidine kinase [Chitinophaga sancti]